MKITAADLTPVVQITTVNPAPTTVTESADSISVKPVTINVEISKEGREKLDKEKLDSEKNADIDNAPLPDNVKEVLKNIRKLQEKIAEKNQELMELLNDKSLSEEDLKRQRETLSTELRSMQSALSQATNALNNAMSSNNMDSKSRGVAKGLIGMK